MKWSREIAACKLYTQQRWAFLLSVCVVANWRNKIVNLPRTCWQNDAWLLDEKLSWGSHARRTAAIGAINTRSQLHADINEVKAHAHHNYPLCFILGCVVNFGVGDNSGIEAKFGSLPNLFNNYCLKIRYDITVLMSTITSYFSTLLSYGTLSATRREPFIPLSKCTPE